ncbi:MAG: DNA gyrase inhibitor YacG [Pseudomonadota bacterium]|nr:DNA gyrase inhibitor YacG [Pseudomonadota bacterium]
MADLSVQCPNCKKSVRWIPSNKYRPFCSDRCKLLDLGEWAAERRSISADRAYTDRDTNDSNNL